MSYTTKVEYVLHCDEPGCKESTDFGSKTLAATRRDYRKNGWLFLDGCDYCPDHAMCSAKDDCDDPCIRDRGHKGKHRDLCDGTWK